MDFKKYLLESAENIDIEVGSILEKWRHEAGNISTILLPLIDEFIKSNQGGKGIRGVLVRLGYQLVNKHLRGVPQAQHHLEGGQEEITKVAAAYEILHTSILVHDDIMDQDIERRGQPSLYQALGGHARNALPEAAASLQAGSRSEAGRHYGISQAISLADAGFFLAIKVITQSKFEDRLKNQALNLFAKIMVDTSIGQMLDVDMQVQSSKFKVQSKENIVKTINLLKTARYTISGPLRLGAILSGAKFGQLAKLDQFGENLGIAYQIRDDILDGDVESVEDAKERVLEYSSKALKLIPEITDDIGFKKILEELTKYLVERKK